MQPVNLMTATLVSECRPRLYSSTVLLLPNCITFKHWTSNFNRQESLIYHLVRLILFCFFFVWNLRFKRKWLLIGQINTVLSRKCFAANFLKHIYYIYILCRSFQRSIRDLSQRGDASMPLTISTQLMPGHPFTLAQSELVLINLHSVSIFWCNIQPSN